MSNYASLDDTSVSYTESGPTTAEETHRSIKITVTNNLRTLYVFGGYQGTVIKSETLGNNIPAFTAFLAGLQTQGYLVQRHTTATDILGRCALGNTYEFNTEGIDNAPSYLWTSSCSGSPGTFGGILVNVQQLFTSQIPDYSNFISDTGL